jgi:integrase
MRRPLAEAKKMRVGDYARSWLESKALRLDPSTVQTYTDALEDHILPALGDFYYDQLMSTDVQKWLDSEMLRGWTTDVKGRKDRKKKARRSYSRNSIGVWFRVFRTMTRDAMVALDLPRDPTLRVSLPEPPVDHAEPNSLTPEQLAAFLEAMRTSYPQHYALVATLAYTGLRFCHASALRWEDWDEQAGVLRVVRKHFRGKIGPVSRKKQAPKESPVEPELAEIFREHRRLCYERRRRDSKRAGCSRPRRAPFAHRTRSTERGRSVSGRPRSRSGSPSTGCATRSPTWYAGPTWTRW